MTGRMSISKTVGMSANMGIGRMFLQMICLKGLRGLWACATTSLSFAAVQELSLLRWPKLGVACGPVIDLSLSPQYDLTERRVTQWVVFYDGG